jgi:hypothetical protein
VLRSIMAIRNPQGHFRFRYIFFREAYVKQIKTDHGLLTSRSEVDVLVVDCLLYLLY